MTVKEIEHHLATMTRAEKAEVLSRLALEVADAWPGIERTPGVMGGDACVVRTRIAVWLLEQMRRLGTSEAEILASYPALRAADLVHAWAYVDAHRDEIDDAIRDHEEA